MNTTKSFLRLYRMLVETAGSQGFNDGAIWAGTGTVTAGVPAVKYGHIVDEFGQSLMGFYTVPAGKQAFLLDTFFTVPKGKAITASITVRPFGGVFNIKDHFNFYEGVFQFFYPVPVAFDEKSDIECRGLTDSGTSEISAGFNLVLVDKVLQNNI